MLKKTITYTDYEDNKRTEDFYFNLSKAELLEMEMSTAGGLEKKINAIVQAQDTSKIMALFKDIILKAYGEKSEDGRRFVKSEELSSNFCQTEAYSELIMELLSDTNKASAFISGIIPADISKQAAEEAAKRDALSKLATPEE